MNSKSKTLAIDKALVPASGFIADGVLTNISGAVHDHFKLAEFRHERLAGFPHLYSFMDFARAAIGGSGTKGCGYPPQNRMKVFAYGVIAAEVVANYYRITPQELFSSQREQEPLAGARCIAIAITVQCGGFQKTEVAAIFSRDRTTITHAVQIIEEKRFDDGGFDLAVDMLENAVLEHWMLAGDADGLSARLEMYL